MHFLTNLKGEEAKIIGLFKDAFTTSEGLEQGNSIAKLVQKQLNTSHSNNIFVVTAEKYNTTLGACVFTRLTFDQDHRVVFALAPVAVSPNNQGKGGGQKLLTYGLDVLRNKNVDVVMTYGDPNYYNKVEFLPVSEKNVSVPFCLKYPHGWLNQRTVIAI